MTDLLEDLKKLLAQKKSKSFYAEKLGISVGEVEDLLRELRGGTYIMNTSTSTNCTNTNESFSKVNLENGTYESSVVSDFEPKSIEELIELHKVDTSKYTVSTYWTKQKGEKFTSSLLCKLIQEDSEEHFREEFLKHLENFKPAPKVPNLEKGSDNKVMLVIPKQDAHYNKYDIYGENSIEDRFYKEFCSTDLMLRKATATNTLDEIFYIIGSDQFNSEWTNLTTKGTPQQNILSYQEGFEAICNHEISIINLLLSYCSKVKVVFVPGNHDEFVGWHLIKWLQSYFRSETNLLFHTDEVNTKYYRYGNSAIMLNHGDAIKPKELAQKFPIGFKDEWSNCENFYIFTGDKHTELSLDIHGIKFYQVPQLSSASSKWDDKQGYIDSKAEMTAFVITETNGMSDVYKHLI